MFTLIPPLFCGTGRDAPDFVGRRLDSARIAQDENIYINTRLFFKTAPALFRRKCSFESQIGTHKGEAAIYWAQSRDSFGLGIPLV
jgi:hypothetical protein